MPGTHPTQEALMLDTDLVTRIDDGFRAAGADMGRLERQLAEAMARLQSGRSAQLAALLQARIGAAALATATAATNDTARLPAGFRPGSGGINAVTGKHITGWAHVQQSIRMILATQLGSRVMRRDFGSDVPRLIDAPMTDTVILAVYVAVASALDRWEPRFKLTQVEFTGTLGGQLDLLLTGIYMPRGHLGDRTPAREDGGLRRLVADPRSPEQQWLVAA
jgi:phage baseplate assembly protein W